MSSLAEARKKRSDANRERKTYSRTDRWPAPLESAAFHGLAGEIIRIIEPHTEADQAALLGQFLVALGNVIGRNPYFQVEATHHHFNLFLTVVGDTAKARKGTSWGHIDRLFSAANPDFSKLLVSGLSSGEGLIWAVRDPAEESEEDSESDSGQPTTEE